MEVQIIGSSSSGNSYLLTDGETTIMLDCGLPIKRLQEATGYTLSTLDGVLVSHGHSDHIKAHKELARMGIDLYSHAETWKHIGVRGHRYKSFETGSQFAIGTLDILPFDLVHDIKNHGFLIYSNVAHEKAIYITDTQYVPYRFKGINIWMVECNHDINIMGENVESGTLNRSLKHRIQQSHLSLDTVRGIFAANDMSDTERIYLLHLSDENSDAEKFKQAVRRLTGAEVIVC